MCIRDRSYSVRCLITVFPGKEDGLHLLIKFNTTDLVRGTQNRQVQYIHSEDTSHIRNNVFPQHVITYFFSIYLLILHQYVECLGVH